MSGSDLNRRALGLLLNAIQKRAWGESLNDLDPGDLVDELRPAISDAIKAVGDRGSMASILLDLYQRYAGSDSETISMLFRASSSTLQTACERALGQAGTEVIELLREALFDETDEEAVMALLFALCRFAVNTIPDPVARLNILRNACHQALDATDDPGISNSLREALEVSARQDGRQAPQALLDYYYHEVAWGAADDPWPLLEELIESLNAIEGLASGDEPTIQVLMQALREAVADEGVERLWEDYQELLEEMGESGGFENAEVLLETYRRTVRAVSDPMWVSDQVLGVCDDIACSGNDISFWLPDREQVSRACLDMIDAVAGPTAARKATSRALEEAILDTGAPWGVLAKTFNEVVRRLSDDERQRIGAVLVRSSQKAMSHVLSNALKSAHEVIENRERIVSLLREAAEDERAFRIFQRVQDATSSMDDRHHAMERLFAVLSEREPHRNQMSSVVQPSDTHLFRAFISAATSLGDPVTAAHVLANIYMETQLADHDVAIEHALSGLGGVIEILEDPASETEVMYGAYLEAITDGHDPYWAVEALLEATREAITTADDPARAIEVLISGLSVKPAGWPPAMPGWAIPG